MHILVSGEGRTDIGSCQGDEPCNGEAFEIGPMAWLVDQIVERVHGYSSGELGLVYALSKPALQSRAKGLKPMSLRGKRQPEHETKYFFRNARALAQAAIELEENLGDETLAVLFRDADGTQSTRRGEWDAKWRSMLTGFEGEGFANGVPMIPKPKSEAWLLCALKIKQPYQQCDALEDESGNDSVPRSLKQQLEEALGEHPGGCLLAELVKTRRGKDGWDSRDTILESEDLGPVTIDSLHALLVELVGEAAAEDMLERLLTEDQQAANIVEGIRRSVITKMELRDRPILDQYQDEIFRLPLNKRLALLGPPGTGKTTTLIRRLGQKLDLEFLDDGERATVERVAQASGIAHSASWIMFTPTELLKQYLQEAFNREDIAAPNQRIRTWHEFRRELGREAFGVLRTASGNGSYVLKESATYLAPETEPQAIVWFEDFDKWQRARFLEEVSQSAQRLGDDQDVAVSVLGQKLMAILEKNKPGGETATLIELAADADKANELRSKLKDETDQAIKGSETSTSGRLRSPTARAGS